MDYLGLAKQLFGLVVSLGTGAIVKNAIEHTTPSNISTLNKVGVCVGGLVLSMMVGDVATRYAGEKIDEVAEKFKVNDNAV